MGFHPIIWAGSCLPVSHFREIRDGSALKPGSAHCALMNFQGMMYQGGGMGLESRSCLFILRSMVLLVAPVLAHAQAFPSKVVRIINAQGPGTLDVLARGYAQELTRYWGQPVVVEVRTGAASIVGAEAVARSAPDGHTLLVTSSAAFTVNQWVTK